MPTLEVPSEALDQVKALIREVQQQEVRARIAELDRDITALEAEWTKLVTGAGSKSNATARPRRSARRQKQLTDDAIVNAIRAGADTGTVLANQLGVSAATVNGRLKTLIESGAVVAEGQRRGRRLSAT
jgi:biotin operon repressor